MAGGRKGARKNTSNRQQPGHQAGLRSGQSTTNIYAALAGSEETDEVNSHLAERFGRARAQDTQRHQYADPERVPQSVAPRINNDIAQYYRDAQKSVANAGPWLEKPEIPLSSEVLPPAPGFDVGTQIIDLGDVLQSNKVRGAYENREDYLQTQYELLKEDAIRPLREAVTEVRRDPWRDELDYPPSSSIGIYEPVYITSVVFSLRGLAARVAFSLSRVKKFIRWKQSKRLITGSLVALSPYDDAFQSKCVLATIAARPLSGLEAANPPEIDIFFARAEDIEIDPMKKWIMVECRSSFFEASRHTLMSLQHMMREPFPLSEHLVHVQKNVEPPAYVQNNPYTDMSSLVSMEDSELFQNVNILQQWPSIDAHGLDRSQSKALKRILTNRLAIVQGPPGTGKTYVSVVALKILLANLRREDPPIIVTCQTNHALDQLLRHVAEFEPNFIRLGGRSKDTDKIKKRTLYEVRMSTSQPRIPGNLKNKATAAMKQLTHKMQMLLAPLNLGGGCLDHRLLVRLGLITDKQAESLEIEAQYSMGISQNTPGIQIEQWLGKSLIPSRRPIQPDDFGMEYEEEDFDEIEQLEELEAEAVARDDDDIEALKGPVTSLCDNYTGKGGALRSDDEIRNLLKKNQDLTAIAVLDRGPIYKYFQRQTKRFITREFRKLASQYEQLVLQRKIGQWEQDQRLLRDQRLIGMTTTGLSKYRALIASLRPRVVLVEEAAETLEAPVAAACVPSLEHLILVGDHQQLRPHCQIHELEDEPYFFNLSLFERMVQNDIALDCLSKQRRMIPEIRRLLYPIYGKTLKDHTSVRDAANRPPVEGMGGNNSFFFTHEWLESRDNNMSALNNTEADMIVGFVDYLVINGVESKKITILTFYNGQRKLLLKKLRNHQNLRGLFFNVVTVDSYQGEENDIVLLSLVRSNKKGGIGFLAVDNRVCVALSRAKRGFYIFGNAEKLACESSIWAEVVKIMHDGRDIPDATQQRRIGYHFPLECKDHDRKTWIEHPDDWQLINGGCDQECRCVLPCGHTCMLKCHPFDNDRINCTQMCTKRVPTCGHPCAKMCCEPCHCIQCERRGNGVKSMLKPAHAKGAGAFKSKSQHALLEAGVGKPQPPAPSMTTEGSGSSPGHWRAFANGGAKEDDARILRKRQEDEAQFQAKTSNSGPPGPTAKLISVSPRKKASGPRKSTNTDLLVDLEVEAPTAKRGHLFTDFFSYGSTAAPAKDEKVVAVTNLLD